MISRIVLSPTVRPLSSSFVQLNSRCLSLSSTVKSAPASQDTEKKGFLAKFLGPESSIASKNFTNRWAMFVPAFATHICLGAPYGKVVDFT